MSRDIWTVQEKYTALMMADNGLKRNHDFNDILELIAKEIGKKKGSVRMCLSNMAYIGTYGRVGLKGYDKDQEIAVNMYINLYGRDVFKKLG